MIMWLFTYATWPVDAKMFPLHFCELFIFLIAWKTTSYERKNFFAIYGCFCEIDAFSLAYFQFAILICAIWRVMNETEAALDESLQVNGRKKQALRRINDRS